MLKAIFWDLDETLCDTTGANNKALELMGELAHGIYGEGFPTEEFTAAYLKGIYRDFDARYAEIFLPIEDEGTFRLELIEQILWDLGMDFVNESDVEDIQSTFDESRMSFFDFFHGMEAFLEEVRHDYKNIVITNGPIFSQRAKVDTVTLRDKVDHVIIGGEEPAQKPHASIFEKALKLAECEASEAIHIGDSLSADIVGANGVGIPSIWVSHGQKMKHDIAKPDYVVEHPREIITLLKSDIFLK